MLISMLLFDCKPDREEPELKPAALQDTARSLFSLSAERRATRPLPFPLTTFMSLLEGHPYEHEMAIHEISPSQQSSRQALPATLEGSSRTSM